VRVLGRSGNIQHPAILPSGLCSGTAAQ
jgi:hypothetical protein